MHILLIKGQLPGEYNNASIPCRLHTVGIVCQISACQHAWQIEQYNLPFDDLPRREDVFIFSCKETLNTIKSLHVALWTNRVYSQNPIPNSFVATYVYKTFHNVHTLSGSPG